MLPALAVLGSVTSLAIGTSYAKHLFPLIGAQGTSALRVGFSALLLLLFWRPWRWKTSRVDAITILRYGLTLGLMNLLFYMALRTIPFGIAVRPRLTDPRDVFPGREFPPYTDPALADGQHPGRLKYPPLQRLCDPQLVTCAAGGSQAQQP